MEITLLNLVCKDQNQNSYEVNVTYDHNGLYACCIPIMVVRNMTSDHEKYLENREGFMLFIQKTTEGKNDFYLIVPYAVISTKLDKNKSFDFNNIPKLALDKISEDDKRLLIKAVIEHERNL